MPPFARQCLRLEFRLKSNLAISVNQVVSLKVKNGFLAVHSSGQAQTDKLRSDFRFDGVKIKSAKLIVFQPDNAE
jgi:hypothetical protein